MPFRKPHLAALSAAVTVSVLACGPEFTQMLTSRARALAEPVDFDFATALGRLAAPAPAPAASAFPSARPAALTAARPASTVDAAHLDSAAAKADGASASQAASILAMRQSVDGDDAYTKGAALPAPWRLYTAGAVDFAAGMDVDTECPDDDGSACRSRDAARRAGLLRAASRFEAVLRLPPDSAKTRSAWAAFSLGRTDRALDRATPALAAFQETRRRVARGAADPLQLADASLGEEARVDYEQGRFAQAVALYGEQARHGSQGAVLSLREMAERLYGDPALTRTLVADRDVRQLLVAYALAIGDGTDGAEPIGANAAPVAATLGPSASTPAASATVEPSRPPSPIAASAATTSTLATIPATPAASAAAPATPPSPIATSGATAPTVAAIPSTPAPSAVAPADAASSAAAHPGPSSGTAALANVAARSQPAAQRLSALLDAIVQGMPPGAPVQDADRLAALAYRTGRYELAARFAAQARSPLASWVDAKLALRRGDAAGAAARYAEAVRSLEASPGADASQPQRYRLRAENGTLLLARGEFTQALAQWWSVGDKYWLDLAYVAERVVTTDELKAFVDASVPVGTPRYAPVDDDELVSHATDPGGRLRDLLARRLMRDGRIDDALPYFHAPDKRWHDPDLRRDAAAYGQALRSARRAWTAIGRAESRFEAATLAHEHGLDFWGTEGTPDGAVLDGNFQQDATPPDARDRASAQELARYRSSAPVPDERYHYRQAVVAQAVAAADDLPPRSQAFAAVMCQATGWTFDAGHPESTRQLYARYLRQGAAVPWAAHFGRDCPEPDFQRARWGVVRHDVHVWRRAHKTLAIGLAAMAAALFGGAAWGLARRRVTARNGAIEPP